MSPAASPMKKKLIIDTDPGVDDAMAILCAFNSPEVEVVGLTTIYGNVPTKLATKNALRLLEVANMKQVPVAQGSLKSIKGGDKERIADFVHGKDGFGNIYLPEPTIEDCGKSAAEFIVEAVNAHPGEVTILALAALTNIALAIEMDPTVPEKWGELVVLGGAFFVNGNVNPASEANIFGDPDAADIVLGSSCNIRVIGLDATHSCRLTAGELTNIDGTGQYGSLVTRISQFYLQYHKAAYEMDAIFLHDPAAFAVVVAPELFTWRKGAVRVVLDGVAKGHTIMDAGLKNWVGTNPWMDRPAIQVALGVDAAGVTELVKQRLTA